MRYRSILLIVLAILAGTSAGAESTARLAADRIEAGASLDIASYRHSGLVSPFLGGSASVLAVGRHVESGEIAVDGGVGVRVGALSNLLGAGDVASTVVPLEGVQRTAVMFGDRYGITFELRFGTVVHFEPGWQPVFGFSMAAQIGNRIVLLPWLALDLGASAMHVTPRGVDVSVLASHIGLTTLP
ncbi:MAG: hypothetical protein ACOC7V_11290 [Spirochaetota bacterium]